MSYTQIIYHIILHTKNSIPAIEQTHSEQLYRYIWGIIKNKKGTLYRINGTEDHKKETFREEIIRVFKEMGVKTDERFL